MFHVSVNRLDKLCSNTIMKVSVVMITIIMKFYKLVEIKYH